MASNGRVDWVYKSDMESKRRVYWDWESDCGLIEKLIGYRKVNEE